MHSWGTSVRALIHAPAVVLLTALCSTWQVSSACLLVSQMSSAQRWEHCRLIQAATQGCLEGVSLPPIGLPSSAKEHASKVRKMRARAQACTCSGSKPAAQVHWSVHAVCCDTLPEPVWVAEDLQGPSLLEGLLCYPGKGSRRTYLQEAGKSELQPWRVPMNYSFRLIRRSV